MMNILSALQKVADKDRAKGSQRFFKTGVGEYGYGDIFLGATVPQCREIAREFFNLKLEEIERHLHSKYHEERLIALLVLVEKYKLADKNGKKEIYDFYLANKSAVNNWDLVDLSAHKIVGEYFFVNPEEMNILYDLVKSENVWDRRIAILSTFAFIKYGRFGESLDIAKKLMKDKHDLIQKAVGWMLREIGKRDVSVLKTFLMEHYKNMPRTMLRYSIERFPEEQRKKYLRGEI